MLCHQLAQQPQLMLQNACKLAASAAARQHGGMPTCPAVHTSTGMMETHHGHVLACSRAGKAEHSTGVVAHTGRHTLTCCQLGMNQPHAYMSQIFMISHLNLIREPKRIPEPQELSNTDSLTLQVPGIHASLAT